MMLLTEQGFELEDESIVYVVRLEVTGHRAYSKVSFDNIGEIS